MRVARWRWVLVPMVVVVAGCLPQQPTADLPASFLAYFGTGATFTVQSPPAGQTGEAVVAVLRAQDPRFRGRAVAVYGVIDCHGDPQCHPGPVSNDDGGPARTVWVVVYPDCDDGEFINVAGVAHDVGWVVVDAVEGIDGGYEANTPCPGALVP